jgi:hypothetical protein
VSEWRSAVGGSAVDVSDEVARGLSGTHSLTHSLTHSVTFSEGGVVGGE